MIDAVAALSRKPRDLFFETRPAEQAGLRPAQIREDGSLVPGDVITAVDGQDVESVNELIDAQS